MAEEKVRRRERLRSKEAKAVTEALAGYLGAALWPETATLESAEHRERRVLIVDGLVAAVEEGGGWILTVRGLLKYRPTAKAVTVDMGAVRFVTNGADVMAPGIVAADESLQVGDWCWVRDENHGQPLACGVALVPGSAMPKGRGKAVRVVSHIGDRVWDLG